MTPESLLSFVQSHDGMESAYLQNGVVYALVSWIHCETLEHGADLERIGSTLKECRASLGY